jgi:hypothetical protein
MNLEQGDAQGVGAHCVPKDDPERGRFSWLKEHRQTLILGAVGIGFVVGAFLLEGRCEIKGGWVDSTFPKIYIGLLEATQILGKVGEALIIAAAIGLAVDPAIKIRLFDEVLTYAGLELWTTHLPPSVKQSVNELIGINLVRDDWHVKYTLAQEGNLLKVTSVISGYVRNTGRRNDTIQNFAMVDPSMIEGAPESDIVWMEAYFDGELPIVNGRPVVTVQLDGTKATTQYPQIIKPGQKLFTLVELAEYRPLTFILPLFTATTVVRTMLTINYDPKLIEVHVSTGTSDDIPASKKFEGSSVWNLQDPLLKGHCIQTRWTPVPKIAPSPVNPVPSTSNPNETQASAT